MRQANKTISSCILGLVFTHGSWAASSSPLEIVHDSGRSVPLSPYVAQIVGGAEDAGVMDGLRFPYRTQLRSAVLARDGVKVFDPQWFTQPVFVLAADEPSIRWLAFNHAKLVQLSAVGIVVQAGSAKAFKVLQRMAAPLHLAPDTGSYLTEQLGAVGAGVYPLLVHSDGKAYQILPQTEFGAAQ